MKASNVIWGLVFIFIGVVIGLNALNITSIDIFFDGWWTLFIIVPSFINIFNKEDKTGSFIWFMVGVILLLACNDFISFDIIGKLLFPAILVIIGLSIIFKNTFDNKVRKEINKVRETKRDDDTISGIFKEEVIHEDTAKNIDLEAIFGSVQYDLQEAKLKKDVAIKTTAVFGSIKIIVPSGCNVKFKTSGIFNDHINKVGNTDSKNTIYVDSFALFGSVIVSDK